MSGYIRLWRSIRDKQLYKNKPFCELGAWVDLLLEANFKDKPDAYGEVVGRGELHTSEYHLMQRWGWDRSRVHRFLRRMRAELRIELETNHRRTKIRITNYKQYQAIKTRLEPDGEPLIEPDSNQRSNITEGTIQEETKEPATQGARPRKKLPPRATVPFGDTGSVLLTVKEHEAHAERYGVAARDAAIAYLDNEINLSAENLAKYGPQDHNRVLHKWVYNAVARSDRAAREVAQAHVSTMRVGTHGTSMPPSKLQQVQQRNAEARARVVAAADRELPAQLEIGGPDDDR